MRGLLSHIIPLLILSTERFTYHNLNHDAISVGSVPEALVAIAPRPQPSASSVLPYMSHERSLPSSLRPVRFPQRCRGMVVVVVVATSRSVVHPFRGSSFSDDGIQRTLREEFDLEEVGFSSQERLQQPCKSSIFWPSHPSILIEKVFCERVFYFDGGID